MEQELYKLRLKDREVQATWQIISVVNHACLHHNVGSYMTSRNPESLKKMLSAFRNLLFGHVPARAVAAAKPVSVTGQAGTALGDVLPLGSPAAVRNCTTG